VQDQPLRTVDDLIAEINGKSIEELVSECSADGPRLITVDELRAAGALDVPPEWRKSLGGKLDSPLPLFPDDDEQPETRQPAPVDHASDESPDELG
jgi:hypothetical protein